MKSEMIERFMRTIRTISDFDRVEFMILYGFESNGEAWEDLCVYYKDRRQERDV